MRILSYKQLIVWQKSQQLIKRIYLLANELPADEKYGLVSQMKRASISISANIVEGRFRGTRKEFRHFLIIARGSAAETSVYLDIIKMLELSKDADLHRECEMILIEILKILHTMIRKLS